MLCMNPLGEGMITHNPSLKGGSESPRISGTPPHRSTIILTKTRRGQQDWPGPTMIPEGTGGRYFPMEVVQCTKGFPDALSYHIGGAHNWR